MDSLIYFRIPTQKLRYILYRLYSLKRHKKDIERDTTVYDLVSAKSKPKSNLLSVFGIASTGALGIKKMINNERPCGNMHEAKRPYPLYFFHYDRIAIRNVACGYGFTLFSGRSKSQWQLYGCGINNDSQIGFQEVKSDKNGHQVILEPTEIRLPCPMTSIRLIGCGRAHSVVVGDVADSGSDTQVVFSFGNNAVGQCGRPVIGGEIYRASAVVHRVAGVAGRVVQVECGEASTYLLLEDGAMLACGSNLHGQLAANNSESHSGALLRVGGGLEREVVKQISCRSNTVLALTEKGTVWAWGDNQHGLVFTETDESSVSSPRMLEMPDGVGKVMQVSAGDTVAAVLDEAGKIHTWGQFVVGLGPSRPSVATPTVIPPGLFGAGLSVLDGNEARIVSVHCGGTHCAAISSWGSLYVWGEVGLRENGPQTFPVRMPLTFNAKRVFMGADHTVVMGASDF